MWKKFKEFAFKGNAFDLAIGVVIGTAFSKIVNSLVADIIMPIVGFLTGGIDFTTLALKISDDPEAAALTYGNFIQNVVDFFIIAFSIFLMVYTIGKVKEKLIKKQEEAVEEAPAAPTEAQLLAEIRDLLKKDAE